MNLKKTILSGSYKQRILLFSKVNGDIWRQTLQIKPIFTLRKAGNLQAFVIYLSRENSHSCIKKAFESQKKMPAKLLVFRPSSISPARENEEEN